MNKRLSLSKVDLKNFKNLQIKNGGFDLKNLNILIGPNGSGKSNFISVLKFLRNSVLSGTEDARKLTELEQSIIKLGTSKMLDAAIMTPSVVSFEFDFHPTEVIPKGLNLNFELLVKGAGTIPAVKKETLCDLHPSEFASMPYYYYKSHDFESGKGVISIINEESQGKSHFESLKDIPVNRLTLNSLSELLEETGFSPDITPAYKVRRQMIETLSDWRFYNANDMNLKNIRESEPKIGPGDDFLSPSGENLPIALDNLCQKYVDFDDIINHEMKRVLPQTRKIRAVRSGRLRLTVEWYIEEMNEPFYLNDISDGSVRMLCWAIVLHSPEPPALLVIDEPEIGLHPSWMIFLSEWIIKASERTQVIVSTHSPDLLDHFSQHHQKVICFEYDGKNYFVPKNLEEDKLSPMFEDGWQLGDLYRVGDPSVGGWAW